jgi:hypothetical protein
VITALSAGFSDKSVWDVLTAIVGLQSGMSLAGLLIMVVFLVLAVMLLVYYVLRLVVLYIGAVLAPIVFMIWLLPGFRDFAESAMKTYLTTIFVLFIHVVILQLAASIFVGMVISSPGQQLNPLMSMIVGIATILALLKTQGVMAQMSYVSLGPRTASRLGGQLSNVIRHYNERRIARAVTGDRWPEGLSRGGVDRTGSGRKSMFGKSNTVVLNRGGSRGSGNNNPNHTKNHSPSASKRPTGSTRAAPKIGKADK